MRDNDRADADAFASVVSSERAPAATTLVVLLSFSVNPHLTLMGRTCIRSAWLCSASHTVLTTRKYYLHFLVTILAILLRQRKMFACLCCWTTMTLTAEGTFANLLVPKRTWWSLGIATILGSTTACIGKMTLLHDFGLIEYRKHAITCLLADRVQELPNDMGKILKSHSVCG